MSCNGCSLLFCLMICERRSDTVFQRLHSDVVGLLKHDCAVALVRKLRRKLKLEVVHERGLKIEVHRVLRRLVPFPRNAHGAATLARGGEISGLAPFECFLQRANARCGRSRLQNQFAKRHHFFAYWRRVAGEHARDVGIFDRYHR